MAIQLAARVLLQVVQAQAKIIVSVVIAIVITPQDVSFTKVKAVHIGYATFAFESIVHVLAVVSAHG